MNSTAREFFFRTCLSVFSLVVSVFAFPVCELLIKMKRKKKRNSATLTKKKCNSSRRPLSEEPWLFLCFFGVLVTTFLYFVALLFVALRSGWCSAVLSFLGVQTRPTISRFSLKDGILTRFGTLQRFCNGMDKSGLCVCCCWPFEIQCHREPRLRMNVAVYQMIRRWQPEMLDFIFDGDLTTDVQTEKLVLIFCSFPRWRRLCRSSIWWETARLLFTSCLRDPRFSFFSVWIKSLFDAPTDCMCCQQNKLHHLSSGTTLLFLEVNQLLVSCKHECQRLINPKIWNTNIDYDFEKLGPKTQLHIGDGTRDNSESCDMMWSNLARPGCDPEHLSWKSGSSVECFLPLRYRVCRPYLHGDHFPGTSRSMLVAQLYCCATGCTSYKPKEPDKSFSFRHFPVDQRLKIRWTAEHLEGYRAASNCSLSQEVVGWYDLIYN